MLTALLLASPGLAGSYELGLGPALVQAPFRDAQVSARRAGGGSGGFAASFDTLDAGRYDRVSVVGTIGRRDGWFWRGLELRSTLAPDVVELGAFDLRVGGELAAGLTVRSWRDNVGWRGHVTLGPAVGLGWRVHDGERSQWTAEWVASTPLVGVIGRPGWAAAFQTGDHSLADYSFASLHRLRGGRTLLSLLWQREGRASIRFQAELSGRVVTWRHRLAEVQHVLSTLLYWRL